METEEKYYSFPVKSRFRPAEKFQPVNFPSPRKLTGRTTSGCVPDIVFDHYCILEIQKQAGYQVMHHLIRTRAMRSVDELVHITQFNGRILIDFVT